MELIEEIGLFILAFLLILKLRPQLMSKFEIICDENQKNKNAISSCPSLNKGRFYPTPYLSLGVLQALFGSKSKHADSEVKFKKEYISFSGYGEFGIDWAYMDQPDSQRIIKKNKLICVFPGLSSPIDQPYIINILAKCYRDGFEVCLLNDRFYTNRDNGRGISLPAKGNFKFVDDYKHILDYIKEQYKDYVFYGIGHSFGANTLTKYLGLYHSENIFSAAVCVSNPWDFDLTSRLLPKSINDFLMKSRMNVLRTNRDIFEKNKPAHLSYDFNQVLSSKNCNELDRYFTSVCLGYPSSREYYKGISCIHEIQDIKIPVLFLQSRDDPVISELALPVDEIKLNPNLIMVITNTGGHIGWFEGIIQPQRWYIKPSLEFINYFDSLLRKNIKNM